MLIISGTAQFTLENGNYSKDDVHIFNLFSLDEDLENNLNSIETYLNNLGWDNIFVEETQIINDKSELDHKVLLGGYDKAMDKGYAVVINNLPVILAATA